MVRVTLLLTCAAVAGCTGSEYAKPIEMMPHGSAVRANMAAHIINPVPPARQQAPVSDASRPVLATQRYRTNAVEEAAPEDGTTLTGAGE